MKVVAEIWDFVTGGSIAAPAAVVLAILLMLAPLGLGSAPKAALFLVVLVAGFIASTFERP